MYKNSKEDAVKQGKTINRCNCSWYLKYVVLNINLEKKSVSVCHFSVCDCGGTKPCMEVLCGFVGKNKILS